MKSKIGIFLICSIAALTIFGVVLTFYITYAPSAGIDVYVGANGDTERLLEINADGLYPGNEQQFDVNLTYEMSGSYIMTLKFIEGTSGILREGITVDVLLGEQSVTKSLDSLLSGEKIEFIGNAAKIIIIYRMSSAVGNEAQGAKLSFNIELTVSAAEGE